MENIEVGGNLHTATWRWGVLVTSFHNHVYGITKSWKRWKTFVLQKEKEVTLMDYVKKMLLIRHLMTLTQLHLKVAKIT
jgi:hypothetical protein